MKEHRIYRIAALVFVLTLGLTGISSIATVEGKSNVQRVYHEPDPVGPDDEVTVYLVVKSTDNISHVRYYYCEKEPEDKCYLEKDMNYAGNNTYTGNIQKFKAGTKVGYNITIEYDNGSKEYAVPEPESYFYYRVEGSGEDNDSPAPGVALMLGAVGIALFLDRKHRED